MYSESLYPLLHYGWAPLRALRTDRFKLIDVPRPELYDLAQDPAEEENLHGARAESGRRADRRSRPTSGTASRAASRPARRAPEIDERTVARLRSLGYLAGGGGVSVEDEDERARDDPKDRLQLHQKIVDAQSRIGHREIRRRQATPGAGPRRGRGDSRRAPDAGPDRGRASTARRTRSATSNGPSS